ncbi:MAG: hypothetical protein K8S56_00555, partial [Candidatus Cloacimonetes bacterium]|nr:hypothetical protein [Candidatus Cloacimonadota bacterium]
MTRIPMRRFFTAYLLNFILPGVGHYFAGQKLFGIIIFVVWMIVTIVFHNWILMTVMVIFALATTRLAFSKTNF